MDRAGGCSFLGPIRSSVIQNSFFFQVLQTLPCTIRLLTLAKTLRSGTCASIPTWGHPSRAGAVCWGSADRGHLILSCHFTPFPGAPLPHVPKLKAER